MASAGGRIDAVMRRWEDLAGCFLPRPVVLEGDLRDPHLGLNDRDAAWVADNCDAAVHNAASMTFREDSHGEPFRTNVDGIRNLLVICEQAEIRKFHHVSTAYVCGLRDSLIFEDELDVGQQNGNVYEISKLTAEKMVRGAGFLKELTVYRPASVVGDSQTGYTTSTHGFYLPLQLAYAMADKVPTQLMGDRFFRLLGLQGNEGKNLVPVDWLSAAIVYVVTHSEHHGKTYHLTNPCPVTVQCIQEVVQEAIEKYSSRRFVGSLSEEEISQYEELFRNYMEVYRSHWRDDPIFDRTNSDAALAHLPCPPIDHDMLLRIAGYPVQQRFILKRTAPTETGFRPQTHLQRFARCASRTNGSAETEQSIGINITGRGGGQWRIIVRNNQVVGIELGLGSLDQAQFYMNSDTFLSLVEGRCSVDQSLCAGRIFIEGGNGGIGGHQEHVRILEHVVSSR